jgi:hypothetical protein
VALADVVEVELGDDPLAFGAGRDLVAEGFLEGIGDVAEGGLGVGVYRCPPRFGLWLASQPHPLLGFADRPATSGCVAGKPAADVVSGHAEEGLAVALAEVAGLQQVECLVGELEQADQTLSTPACWAARQRRSPAISS